MSAIDLVWPIESIGKVSDGAPTWGAARVDAAAHFDAAPWECDLIDGGIRLALARVGSADCDRENAAAVAGYRAACSAMRQRRGHLGPVALVNVAAAGAQKALDAAP